MTVSAKEILAEAEARRETIISDRRALHAAPEAGADLPRTREYVAGRLREMGYEPKELAGGITAEITGSDTGNCVLLRADMDALCVTEQTDLPFRSQNGCMHACGHALHTASSGHPRYSDRSISRTLLLRKEGSEKTGRTAGSDPGQQADSFHADHR